MCTGEHRALGGQEETRCSYSTINSMISFITVNLFL